MNSSEATELLSTFERDGYVAVPGFAAGSQLDSIVANVQRFIKEVAPGLARDEVFYEDKDDRSTLKQIQHMHKHDEFFDQLMSDSPFRRLAETLLKDEVAPQNMQYFNKPPGVGQPTPPHQDGFYFKLQPCEAVTMWFGLDDVDEENGCVRYVPGSQKQGMRPHGSSGTLGFSQSISDYGPDDQQQEVAMRAKPGDLMVHHALTVHLAGGNQSANRQRRSLGFIYYAQHARADEAAHKAYRDQLAKELSAAGKI